MDGTSTPRKKDYSDGTRRGILGIAHPGKAQDMLSEPNAFNLMEKY
jgi:hypothetical protein